MEPWQKLVQALAEIWVDQDIRLGKFNDAKSTDQQSNDAIEPEEQFKKSA